MNPPGRVILAGLGNPYRGDDGVGPAVVDEVARRLAMAPGPRAPAPAPGEEGDLEVLAGVADPLDLLGRWDGAALAVVVDAARSGAPPGTVLVTDVPVTDLPGPGEGHGTPGPAPMAATSTHGLGFAAAVGLARALGQAPARIVLVTVEGRDFGRVATLDPVVARAVGDAAARVLDVLDGLPVVPHPA